MFRLFVFDLDGTLVDSRRDLADSANLVLASEGAPALDEEAIGHMVGDGAPTLVARAFAAAGVVAPPDALERFLAIYDARLLEYTRPYPGTSEVLHALQQRASLALLTNKPRAAALRVLEGLDLARFFPAEAVVGGDGPFLRKPEPAGLRHLSVRARVAPADTLMVGDSIIDWRTSRRASTAICMARYGFGFHGFPVADLAATDYAIDTPDELLAL